MSQFVKGDRELIKKLDKLSKTEAGKAIRKGTRAGAKLVKSAASSDMPVKTGKSKRGLKVKSMKRSRKGTGTRVTVGKDSVPEFIFNFVEWGHHVGKRQGKNAHKKGSAYQGKNAKRQFVQGRFTLKHASDRVGNEALQTAVKEIAQAIEKAMHV